MSLTIFSKRNACCKALNYMKKCLTQPSCYNSYGKRLKIHTFSKSISNTVQYHENKPVDTTSYFSPYARRRLYTSAIQYGVNVRPMTINSRLAADRLIRDMTEVERQRLTQALQHLNQELELENVQVVDEPTMRQLSLAAFSNAVPFVGFGFLDNAIMIVAGEYIDCTVGCALGISTMAAAAIGNMISDVAGIGLAGYVEGLASRLGVEEPHLTAHQLTMKSTRIACHSGRALGIVIGCIIGMFPLLFIDNSDHGHESEKDENN